MTNWTDYVRAYAEKHGVTYGQAMRKAGPGYRKMFGVKKVSSGSKRGGVVLGAGKKKSMVKRSMKKKGGVVLGAGKKKRVVRRKIKL